MSNPAHPQYPTDTRFEVTVAYRAEGRNEPAYHDYPVEGWNVDGKGRLVPVYNNGQTYHHEDPYTFVSMRALPA